MIFPRKLSPPLLLNENSELKFTNRNDHVPDKFPIYFLLQEIPIETVPDLWLPRVRPRESPRKHAIKHRDYKTQIFLRHFLVTPVHA